MELAEGVRLFEPACQPLDGIFVPQNKGLHLNLERFFGQDASDAHWLAGQMTTDILEYINQSGGDRFWEHAKVLGGSGFQFLASITCVYAGSLTAMNILVELGGDFPFAGRPQRSRDRRA